MSNERKTAVIIGAGPAGLTAAYELLSRTSIIPVVLEQGTQMGGISQTVNYKGNRIDIGGHRFFSKSDRVMNWWFSHLPLETDLTNVMSITYQNQTRSLHSLKNSRNGDRDKVMLVRSRRSRIYFLRKLFDYPISLSPDTLRKLGLWRTMRIGVSYMWRAAFPLKDVTNLEQFFINRFGEELYRTFFKSYTEKVWGVSCDKIDAAWGEQRIKKLSIAKTIRHALSKMLRHKNDVRQKNVETSLIDQFLYPKFGPGQMWDEVSGKVTQMGGRILTRMTVTGLRTDGFRVRDVSAKDANGVQHDFAADYVFSTMPIRELVRSLDSPVPDHVREISEGLPYRDFITVGLLVSDLKIRDNENGSNVISDNWIYIQESDVLAGRLQIFNNWSPGMVADPTKVWIGVEYFCYEGDELWRKSDQELSQLAVRELEKIGIIESSRVLDSTVLRMPKSYPAYFGTYARFDELREYLDKVENLFLVGRNGMHRYNNQDHSMLTAMTAVDNIIEGITDKANIWAVNTEADYHEENTEPKQEEQRAAA